MLVLKWRAPLSINYINYWCYLGVHGREVSPDDEKDENPEEESYHDSEDDSHGKPQVIVLVAILLDEERRAWVRTHATWDSTAGCFACLNPK